MNDWKVIATVRSGGYHQARRLLREFGPVRSTGFLNLLELEVENRLQFLDGLAERLREEPDVLRTVLGRVAPVRFTFSFQSAEEFGTQARQAILDFVPQLAGKSFHVRMHRHGFKGRLSSHEQERRLGETLLEALEKAGTPGRVTFTDPDAIVMVETLGNCAGFALWTRDDLHRYSFLHLD